MSISTWRILTLAAGCLLSGCGAGPLTWPGNETIRPLPGLPHRLEPVPPELRLTPADTIAGSGCRSPLRDPARGIRLPMIRSSGGYADYEAPAGAYGLDPDQLVRVECNTGRVQGAVRR
jgi:hypothetical protein